MQTHNPRPETIVDEAQEEEIEEATEEAVGEIVAESGKMRLQIHNRSLNVRKMSSLPGPFVGWQTCLPVAMTPSDKDHGTGNSRQPVCDQQAESIHWDALLGKRRRRT